MTLAHTTGTITLTNGSATIVGNGTDWQTAGIVGGMVFPLANGNVLPIATVTSNTQMTAAVPWNGATVTTPYSLVRDTAYLQQLTENAQLLTTIIRELRYSSLAALAALAATMGADKFAYATGLNTMAWATLSAFGRETLALGDAAAWRNKIGALSTGGGTVNGSILATGNLSASGGVSGSSLYNISAANADGALYFQTGTVGGATYNRWAWVKAGYGVGEPGANAGADAKLMRWGDGNNYLGTSIVATRKTGAVHFPETPFCQTNLGADIVINPGINTGISVAGFTFNRGGFITGGDLNARNVVHFPIAGWYRCSFTVAANSPDGAATLELVLNGSNVPAHIGTVGATFGVINNTVMLLVNANDYLNMRALGGRIFFAGWNTRCILEFIQPI